MYGDFGRDSFDHTKDRSSVRHQAGRVLLGDDFNEQRDIELHDTRTARDHIIGRGAGPVADVGFQIIEAGGGTSLEVGAGQYYVDGIRVVRREPGTVHDIPTDAGRYLLYLDVWERAVNAVQDPSIREVALGGPDTTVRTEVLHEVRALRLPDAGPMPTCSTPLAEWDAAHTGSTGAMALWVEPGAATTDPCLVPETAGYKGPDNRFVRVEIHDGNYDPTAPGGLGTTTPTFKWAKDNASVVASWSPPVGLVVALDRLGPGGTEGFVDGTWVEFTNDAVERAGNPGIMAEIDEVVAGGIQLVDRPGLSVELTALHDPELAPVVRRWDSVGVIDLVPDTPVDLTDGTNSDGLQVQFEAGRVWRTGDHWTVAARTAILPGTTDRQIDWPVDDVGDPLVLPSKGPKHHLARLALARFDGATWSVVGDCRQEFAPLADLVTFVGRGGDGQEAPGQHWLAGPLIVGAGHGLHPLGNRTVRFSVRSEGGRLSAVRPGLDGSTATPPSQVVNVQTDGFGMAEVYWQLGSATQPEPPGDRFNEAAANMMVRADLLDASGTAIAQPVFFFARATRPRILVAAGGDGQWGWPGETLEIAPRARVSVGSLPAVGSLVEFEVVTTMENGNALNEVSGGSVHASAGLVESEPWPGGSAAFRAVVRTDGEGVAQVQWRLGTEPELPVQRLYAHLLDDEGNRTPHFTFFTAHHSVADEILWDPCKELVQYLPPENGGRHTVQDALDLFCELFVSGADGRLETPSGVFPLNPSTVLSLDEFPEVTVTIPREFSAPSQVAQETLLELSVPATVDRLTNRAIIPGTIRIERRPGLTTVRWRITDGARDVLSALQPQTGEFLVLVTLRPAMFGRANLFADWSGGFRLSTRTGPR